LIVLHSLPGRIRAKNRRLYDKKLSQYIGIYCDNLYGVKFCRVNYKAGTILILYDENKTQNDIILNNVETAINTVKDKEQTELSVYDKYLVTVRKRNKAKAWFLIYGITYLLFKIKVSLFGKFSLSSNVRVLQVASIVTIIGGYPIIKRLYRRFAKPLPTDSDLLLALIALSFTILRESAKGILVLLLKELSDYIKYSAEVNCMRLLRQNMGKTSGMVYLVKEEEAVLIPVSELSIGDVIEVSKGEVALVDGEVIEGKAIVNSLYYTGQPLISSITNGNQVFEGMTVISGAIKVRISRIPETNEKADIAVNDIGIHQKTELYTKNITYLSLGLAAISLIFTQSLLPSLAIMLALSPSATKTAFSSGMKNYISILNKHNIYIRNPNVFEKLMKVDHIIFDKTGTLTYGIMKIRGIERLNKTYSEAEILKICAACEVDNYHPISITLQKAGEEYDINKVQSSILLPSKGIVAQYEDKNILIGNKELMQEYSIDISDGFKIYESWEEKLCTPVFVVIDNALAAIIIMEDIIRESARELISKLKYLGISDITLLSGDSSNKAQHVASLLGIKNVYSNCGYEDKVKIVDRFKESGTVMMIGDGVNDILSMRAADVSISFVNAACDMVKLHSDCIIFEEDMSRLSDLISLTQKAHRRIDQSILSSNVYNMTFGILALFQCIDAFQAKTFNTVNSLMVLLLNQRINYLAPEKLNINENLQINTEILPVS